MAWHEACLQASSLAFACAFCWYMFVPTLLRGKIRWLLLAGVACQLVRRLAAGGRAAATQELAAVRADLAAPFIAAVRPGVAPRKRIEDVVAALCCVGTYLYAYSPLCPLTFTATAKPLIAAAYFCGVLLDGDASAVDAVLLLATWIAFHFLVQLTISIVLHRYFSHRCFEVSRAGNCALAVAACFASQRGPMWWASIHRRHHRFCEKKGDPHSPARDGFWHAHLLWMVDRRNFAIQTAFLRDWLDAYPELLLADLFFPKIQNAMNQGILSLFRRCGDEGTSAALAVGMVLGFATAWHTTFAVNSLCHGHEDGGRGAEDEDRSRCGARDISLLGIASCGDSFHATHHEKSHLARHAPAGHVDLAYLAMRAAAAVGLVRRVKRPLAG